MDPNDLGQGPGEGGGPPAGTSPPSGALEAENAKLKEENAKFRAERRQERTVALVEQHGLTARQAVELASLGSIEEIESKAASFAEANRAAGVSTPPAPAPAPAPAAEPAIAPALAGLDGGEGGGTPTAAPLSWVEEMQKELDAASSLAEMQQIQDKYKALQRERQE